MAALSHWQLPAFRNLHLEESSVFAIRESSAEVCFDMEFVLGERHARYKKPMDEQQHCYRKGRMTFREVSDVKWTNKRAELPPDADENADLGKVDSCLLDAGVYQLRGPWGRLELRAGAVEIEIW